MGSVTSHRSEEGRRDKARGERFPVPKQTEGSSQVDGKQGWFHNSFHGKIIFVVRRGNGSEFCFEHAMFATSQSYLGGDAGPYGEMGLSP